MSTNSGFGSGVQFGKRLLKGSNTASVGFPLEDLCFCRRWLRWRLSKARPGLRARIFQRWVRLTKSLSLLQAHFSFLLALVFAVIVWAVGKPTAEAEATTTVGYVVPDEPAAKAGFQPGDVILAVDGHRVSRFAGLVDSITWYVVRSEGETIPFEIRRGDKVLTLDSGYTRPETRGWERRSLRQVGIAPAITPIVFKVAEGSVAAQAGIEPNDEILAI